MSIYELYNIRRANNALDALDKVRKNRDELAENRDEWLAIAKKLKSDYRELKEDRNHWLKCSHTWERISRGFALRYGLSDESLMDLYKEAETMSVDYLRKKLPDLNFTLDTE